MKKAILKGTAAALICAFAAPAMAQEGPVADTAAGPIRGLMSDRNEDIFVFLGVPYGGPTDGENRFRAPTPVVPWADSNSPSGQAIRAATQVGDPCAGPGYPPRLAPEEGLDLDMSPIGEDCLVLNIWTPALDDGGARPVMVWHHGGGFNAGSGGSFRYDGTNLAANQDVVVITTNHRLNVFGYSNFADLDPARAGDANAGMQDIVQSLEWIRDNIERFGGDPNNVTVFGESGGAGKVTTLMAMPSADGLFHRVVAQSGAVIQAASPEQRAEQAAGLAEALGATAEDPSALSTAAMGDVMANFRGSGPWVDGEILPRHPWSPDAPEVSADVPVMLGWNLTEDTFFEGPEVVTSDDDLVPLLAENGGLDPAVAEDLAEQYRAAFPDVDANQLYFQIRADADRGAEAIHIATLKAEQGGAPAYVYHFAGLTDVRGLMSPHTLEIGYVFDNLDISTRMNGEVTPERQALADMMSEAWTSFARDGVPSAEGMPEWPAFDPANPQIMVFSPDGAEVMEVPAYMQAAISGGS
ncbi:carboxylesterase family protein [Rhodobacterales bacterium HKCCE2091]|nr:carboxylesterase family protein [Rhodobacterales bacterium HKCCE2091]